MPATSVDLLKCWNQNDGAEKLVETCPRLHLIDYLEGKEL